MKAELKAGLWKIGSQLFKVISLYIIKLQIFQKITDYLNHHILVYYIYHDNQPSPIDSYLLNAKNLDSE